MGNVVKKSFITHYYQKKNIYYKHLLPLFKALDAVIRSYLRHGSGEGFTKRFLNLKRLKPERLLLS